MDEADLATWQWAACAVDAAAIGHASGHRPALVRVRVRQLDARSGGLFDGPWTPAASRHVLASRGFRAVVGTDLASFGADDGDSLCLLRSLRLGHAVARGDADAVPFADAASVVEALGSARAGDMPGFVARLRERRPTRAPVHRTPGLLPFAFPWVSRGARGRTVLVGRAVAGYVEVKARDAPVVARLRTPEGTWFDLRRRGDVLLRPLLAPDGTGPLRLDAAADLAASGRAWPDSPFLPPRRMADAVPDLDEHAAPTTLDDAASAPAAAEAQRLAGALHLVEGVLHRETGSPVACLASRSRRYDDRGRANLEVGWSLSCGLDSTTPLSPAPGATGRDPNIGLLKWRSDADVVPGGPSVPLGAHARLRDVAERLRLVEAGRDAPLPLGDDPFEVVDAGAFPDDPGSMAANLEAVERRLRQTGYVPMFDVVRKRAPGRAGGLALVPSTDPRLSDVKLDDAIASAMRASVRSSHEAEADEGVASFAP